MEQGTGHVAGKGTGYVLKKTVSPESQGFDIPTLLTLFALACQSMLISILVNSLLVSLDFFPNIPQGNKKVLPRTQQTLAKHKI